MNSELVNKTYTVESHCADPVFDAEGGATITIDRALAIRVLALGASLGDEGGVIHIDVSSDIIRFIEDAELDVLDEDNWIEFQWAKLIITRARISFFASTDQSSFFMSADESIQLATLAADFGLDLTPPSGPVAARVVIYVSGGGVQNILANRLTDVMVVDSDVDGIPDEDTVDVDGAGERAAVAIWNIEASAALVQSVFKQLEPAAHF